MKEEAAKLLEGRLDPSISSRLVKILERSSHDAAAVIPLLAEIRDEVSIRALVGVLTDTYAGHYAVKALVGIGEQAVPYLEEVIERGGKIRKHAEKTLTQIRDSIKDT